MVIWEMVGEEEEGWGVRDGWLGGCGVSWIGIGGGGLYIARREGAALRIRKSSLGLGFRVEIGSRGGWIREDVMNVEVHHHSSVMTWTLESCF